MKRRTRKEQEYDASTETKVCTKCDERKPYDMFSKTSRATDGRLSRCKACCTASLREYRSAHPEKYYTTSRIDHLKRQYDMSMKDYDVMLSKQGGVCAICGKKEEDNATGSSHKVLYIDHDHKTGKVRGLLCNHCNRGLGFLQDDSSILRSAIEYIEH